jgi:hypothetical protein
MLYKEIITVCSEKHTKPINTDCSVLPLQATRRWCVICTSSFSVEAPRRIPACHPEPRNVAGFTTCCHFLERKSIVMLYMIVHPCYLYSPTHKERGTRSFFTWEPVTHSLLPSVRHLSSGCLSRGLPTKFPCEFLISSVLNCVSNPS